MNSGFIFYILKGLSIDLRSMAYGENGMTAGNATKATNMLTLSGSGTPGSPYNTTAGNMTKANNTTAGNMTKATGNAVTNLRQAVGGGLKGLGNLISGGK
jgi:hypothetical protein